MATPEQIRSLVVNLAGTGQEVDKVVVYLARRGAPPKRPSVEVAQRFARDEDYQSLRIAMMEAVNQIVGHNFDMGLMEEDMELARSLGTLQQLSIDLHYQRTKDIAEDMFGVAKEEILAMDALRRLPDAEAKRERLSMILDVHFGLAQYQIDNPQPDLASIR